MTTYDDKALLFITSTDARIPQGRNARAQHRSKVASKVVSAQGTFRTLDLNATEQDAEGHTRKRQRRIKSLPKSSNGLLNSGGAKSYDRCRDNALDCSLKCLDEEWALPFINPTEILSVATFHVRRMAAMSMDSKPEGLVDVLRRRSWSCLPFASNCFGKDACVDSAIMCVADRIRYLSGSPCCPVSMMKHYTRALRELQDALYEPESHDPQDLLAAVQLLAVYEMLDSLDNGSWTKHVAGAATMIQAYTTLTPTALEKWESRGCGHALPMFSDALMNNDSSFFRTCPWRELLLAIFAKVPDPPAGIHDLMRCLRLLPNLLLDVDSASGQTGGIDNEQSFALLDRAHDLRYRMRSALCGNQLYTSCNYRDILTTFDLLGTFLAGLVALDNIISDLRPKRMTDKIDEDRTGDLCAQLLNLELSASAQCPPEEVLAGFHHAEVFDTEFHT